MQEDVLDKAISLLDRAVNGVEGANISIIFAWSVRDMLSGARMESGQEDMRKKRHDTLTTPSVAPRFPSVSTRPSVATRAQAAKGKAPAEKKLKN